MTTQPLNSRRYEIVRSLRAQDLLLTKTAYAPGMHPRHSHDNARFVFVLKGSFAEGYGSSKRYCRASMTIFRPPREPHWENYDSDVLCLSADVGPSSMKRWQQYRLSLEDSVDTCDASLSRLAASLNNELCISDRASPLAIEGLLLEAAVQIGRHNKIEPQKLTPVWLTRARDFIHEESASNLTLVDIATVAGVHPVHLARVFHRRFGCTIAEYLRRLRVEAASQAIAQSDTPLAQIATDAGFSDQSHFCKIFKRLTGMTPSRYRSQFRSR